MTTPDVDVHALDRQAMADTTELVHRISSVDQLNLPSPCAGWTLGDLLRHMVGHNHGFAAAARGAEPDPAVWDGATLGDDPVAAWDRSAGDVLAAFAADGLPERTLHIFGYGRLPATTSVRMHFVDMLVHGWDVARSLGVDGQLDEELSLAAIRMASRWPDQSWGPTGPFRNRIDVPADAPAYQRLVGLLGRPPEWPDHQP